jgi:hypothetical protein
MHLETAIREHNIFPQITSRVNELLTSSDPKNRSSSSDLKFQVEFDNLRRDLEVARLQAKEYETEK